MDRSVAIVERADDRDLVLSFVTSVEDAKARVKALQDYVRSAMIEGEDYGVVPGTGSKPTLLKPGAEKLCEIYGFASTVQVTQRVEDWDKPFFFYEVKTTLVSKRSGVIVAEGLGSCNSYEAKYRWRKGERVCPNCGQPTILKSKQNDEWFCWAKRGGCGATFRANDARITEQVTGRVPNPDVADSVNTILKMAAKRSKIDAVLSATRSSGLFTQDMLDDEPAEAGAVVAATVVREFTVEHDAQNGTQTQREAHTEAQRPQQAQTTAGPGAATQAQVRAIYSIGRDQHKLSEVEIDQRATDLFGARPSELTKQQASQMIGALKAAPEQNAAKPVEQNTTQTVQTAVAVPLTADERKKFLGDYEKMRKELVGCVELPAADARWNDGQVRGWLNRANAWVKNYLPVEIEAVKIHQEHDIPAATATVQEVVQAAALLADAMKGADGATD